MKLLTLFTNVCLVFTITFGASYAMQPDTLATPVENNGHLSATDAMIEDLSTQTTTDTDDEANEEYDNAMGLDEKIERATHKADKNDTKQAIIVVSPQNLALLGLDYKSAKQADATTTTTTECYQPYICPDPQCNKAHFSAEGLLYHILSVHCTLVTKSTDDPGCVIDGSFSCNYCKSNLNRYTCWFHLTHECPLHTTDNTEMSHE